MADTALSSWALLIWQALQAEGLDTRKIFEDAGVDPKVLSNGDARFESAAMRKLWAGVAENSENPCIGIEVGKLWSPVSFHALGYAWLASQSLQDAMQRFCRYAKVVNTQLVTHLSRKGLDYSFSFESQQDWTRDLPQVLDAAFIALITMCRLLLGAKFSPVEVRLTVASSASTPILEAALGAPVVCGCEINEMIISRNDVERSLPGASLELLRVNENLLQDYLQRIEATDIVHQVERAALELMPSGDATEQKIAAMLNMSGRSMQRRLSEEGTSFTHILQSTREKMSGLYIRENKLSLSEIAYLLGFSEQANFSRAFKRWYDCSPTEYRKEMLKVPA